jgi:bifunctional ADP-heptose synthase (sugar kinase/adenylyltransferase)
MVFAALSVEIVIGKSLRDACRSAMGAAGKQVARIGIELVSANTGID